MQIPPTDLSASSPSKPVTLLIWSAGLLFSRLSVYTPTFSFSLGEWKPFLFVPCCPPILCPGSEQ